MPAMPYFLCLPSEFSPPRYSYASHFMQPPFLISSYKIASPSNLAPYPTLLFILTPDIILHVYLILLLSPSLTGTQDLHGQGHHLLYCLYPSRREQKLAYNGLPVNICWLNAFHPFSIVHFFTRSGVPVSYLFMCVFYLFSLWFKWCSSPGATALPSILVLVFELLFDN